MRLRNVKGAREAIAAQDRAFSTRESLVGMKGEWSSFFGNSHPLFIEIGMGKGRFIMDMARINPDANFIGIEKFSSVMVRAVEKYREEPLPNVCFIRMDAEDILDVFARDEVDGIYLNFSDPWPKDRHAKRRLTSVQFLERYNHILKPEGSVIFKTDNQPLFDFSLEEAAAAGWDISEVTRDLHHSEYAAGNVMTEYEQRFSEKGNPICRMLINRGPEVYGRELPEGEKRGDSIRNKSKEAKGIVN